MLALHACWASGEGLALWGEDAEGFAGGRGPRGSAAGSTRTHPFAASAARLAHVVGEALSELTPGATGGELTAVELLLHLPGRGASPAPSPALGRLVAVPVGSEAGPTGRPVWVPALILAPSPLEGAFSVLAQGDRPGVSPAPSVAFAARLVEAAADLVQRGRVLPALEPGPDPAAARWAALPTGADREWHRRLARGMPAAFAATGPDPLGSDPATLLLGAIAQLVDAGARRRLGTLRLAPAAAGRRGRGQAGLAALLAALVGDDPVVAGPRGGAPRLRAALDAWAATAPALGPVRTCFRLAPPKDGAGDASEPAPSTAGGTDDPAWRLEILLQSNEDPSLVVPAADVWAGVLDPGLAGGAEHPEDRLLADLGRAARLWPPLEAALEEAVPEALPLGVKGAHGFLVDAVPALEDAGFGVMVPPWWRRDRERLGLRLTARPARADNDRGGGVLGLDSLCQFRYEVALGDETLGLDELRRLAAWKAPLVRMRGRWVELDPADLERALAALRRRGEPEATVRDLFRIGLGLGDPGLGLPVVDLRATGWLSQLLGADGGDRVQPRPAPDGFQGVLRPYQERGLGWLAFCDRLGLGACLADDMGLGKTVQLLALVVGDGRDPGRRPPATLLVAPMSVVGNWEREARRFAPQLRVLLHHGPERARGRAFQRRARAADLVLTTFGLALRDQATLAGVRWHRLVLDEAQMVKNPETKQARAVRALRADRRFALTGTPVENRLADLHALMDILNPGLLGSRDAFRRRFALPIERDGDDRAAERLRRAVRPFILRRRKTDPDVAPDLPAKIELREWCTLTREQASLYQAVVEEMLRRVDRADGVERRGLVLAGLTRLKQVCNHPVHLLGDGSRLEGRSGKLARLEAVLGEVVAEGERALCFTQFVEMGKLLVARLERVLGRPAAFLHGGLAKRARDDLVARFQAEDGPPVLVASLKAGGVGLNLTAANHVVHFDRWWNAAVEDQATDRAFRIGQTRQVQVRTLVCVGTLEERIDELIARKRGLAERVVGGGDAWITELSTADLRRLVALDAGSVGDV